jgi:hypothetical protein
MSDEDWEFEQRREEINKDKRFALLMWQLWEVQEFEVAKKDWVSIAHTHNRACTKRATRTAAPHRGIGCRKMGSCHSL